MLCWFLSSVICAKQLTICSWVWCIAKQYYSMPLSSTCVPNNYSQLCSKQHSTQYFLSSVRYRSITYNFIWVWCAKQHSSISWVQYIYWKITQFCSRLSIYVEWPFLFYMHVRYSFMHVWMLHVLLLCMFIFHACLVCPCLVHTLFGTCVFDV